MKKKSRLLIIVITLVCIMSLMAACNNETVTTNAATPIIVTQPQNATLDIGTTHNLTVAASVTDDGTLSYQWYCSITATATNGTAVSFATAATYAAPIDTAGTYYYYVTVTNTNNSVNGTKTATVTSNVATITVNMPSNTPTVFQDGEYFLTNVCYDGQDYEPSDAALDGMRTYIDTTKLHISDNTVTLFNGEYEIMTLEYEISTDGKVIILEILGFADGIPQYMQDGFTIVNGSLKNLEWTLTTASMVDENIVLTQESSAHGTLVFTYELFNPTTLYRAWTVTTATGVCADYLDFTLTFFDNGTASYSKDEIILPAEWSVTDITTIWTKGTNVHGTEGEAYYTIAFSNNNNIITFDYLDKLEYGINGSMTLERQ